MKQFLFLAFLLISITPLFAQRHYVEDGRIRIMGGGIRGEFAVGEKSVIKKNVIKLNLTALGFNNIGVQYERALGGKISFALQGRYMLESLLPGAKQLSDYTDDTLSIYSTLKINSWAVTPEFRLYFRQALKGFYIAPYARVRNIDFNYPIAYIDDNLKPQTINTKGSFLTFGGGLMIGSHFKIGNRISLDWFILGGHYSTTNIDIVSNSSVTLSVNDQQEVRDFLATTDKSIAKLIKNFKYEVSANKLTIKGNMDGVGLRGAGINLGFRF